MKRWKRLATVALVPVVALAGLGVAAVVADQSGLAGAAGRASAVSATSSLDHYVALGDSYAAGYGNGGPGISFLDQTGANETSPDDNCGRTPSAHPVQLNNWFKSYKNIGSLTFSFLACTGATTSNVDANSPGRANGLDGEKNLSTVLGPTYGLGDNGEGYQLGNGSTPNATYKSELQNAKVVTLSAGGNDIYFSDVIATCVAGGIALVARVNVACSSLSPTSSRVRDLYSNITALETVLHTVYQHVRLAAPSAQVYVMGYPDIVPPQPSLVQQTLGCGGIGGIGAISYLAGAENSLNQVIKDQAASAGFHFVDPNIGSNPFSNHSICAKKTWFNLQFHPNAQGQSALFKDFQREIKNVAKTGGTTTGGGSKIAAGQNHTCALITGGTVQCWGSNGYGELGNGTNTDSTVPVNVTGLTGVTAISAGVYQTCALLSGGTVKCWGYNYSGQLGNGTNTDSNVPVSVTGLTGVTAIAAGDAHTCALISGGTVQCWGYNSFSQLGNGTTTNSTVPVSVSGLTGATAIDAGNIHTCALMSGGTVQCWGYNANGQLGDGTTTNSNVPVSVTGLTGASAISAGYFHTCALISGGTVKCWGDNSYGELGNGTNTDSNVPVTVSGL